MSGKVVLITGASKGLGYITAKVLGEKFPGSFFFLAGKSREYFDPTIGAHCEYINMDVTEEESVYKVRNMIQSRHDALDILINNAGTYEVPDTSSAAHFGAQAERILGTNYWGLKRVTRVMGRLMRPGARIVNTSSHLGHLSNINGEDFYAFKIREALANIDISELRLDALMTEFRDMAHSGEWEAGGWPSCAHSVSKIGVNVYTRILQRQFHRDTDFKMMGTDDIVVNSIHPGTHHSKINPRSRIPLEKGAEAIAALACVPHGSLAGQVVWHNMTPITWEEAVTRPSLINTQGIRGQLSC